MLTEAHERVASLIPKGKDNAISRERLAYLTGFADRKIREIIGDLRLNGIYVCSTSGMSGYWMPTRRKELESLADEFHDRGLSCLSTESNIRKFIKVHEDQLQGDVQ